MTVIIHGKKVTDHSPRAGRPQCGLWGVTRANCRFWKGQLLDWTEWYDVHPLVATGQFPGIPERRPDAWAWMKAQDGRRPIWLQGPEHYHPKDRPLADALFAEIPGARSFPIREIQQAAPINGEPNRWFVEMVGMMMAKAVLLDGVDHIILNGIGCITSAEFQIAHRSILYWIAFARGRGVEVTIEGPSIFHTPRQIYAYEKFNYDELERVRLEERERPLRDHYLSLEDVNRKELARGRPRKHKIPPLEEWVAR